MKGGRRMSAVVAALLSGAAAASSSDAPGIGVATRSARLLILAQADPLPDPPLPETPPPTEPSDPTPPRPPGSADIMKGDPFSGTYSPAEVGLGAVLVLAADVSVAIATVAFFVAASLITPGGTAQGLLLLGGFGAVIVDLALVPFAAAYGAWLASEQEWTNGYRGALLGAWLAQGASVIATVAGALIGLGPIIGAALHFIAVPLGASLGLHHGTVPARNPGPVRPPGWFGSLPTRPHELHRAAQPLPPARFVAVAF